MMSGKRSMTPLLAKKIERAIGYPAGVLMAMQTTFDLAKVDEEPLGHVRSLIAA
jgi:plasmid maintenance system antidote protein VapI